MSEQKTGRIDQKRIEELLASDPLREKRREQELYEERIKRIAGWFVAFLIGYALSSYIHFL